MNRQAPVVLIHLQHYRCETSQPAGLVLNFKLNDEKEEPRNSFEEDYRKDFKDLQEKGKEKIRENLENEQRKDLANKLDIDAWINQISLMEESNNGALWVVRDQQPAYIEGSEAENDEMYIHPRFLTNPERFAKEYTSAYPLVDFKLVHPYRKVADILQEHLDYKLTQVWSISDIAVFLEHYFRAPKKFENIKKAMPEKDLKEIIQLFYILKYQFKLKKYLRIRSLKKKDELVKEYIKKITKSLKKKFPGQEFLTQNDLTSLMRQEKCQVPEDYFEKYGKDKSKLQGTLKDFQDYSRYKEVAFGGEKIHDEGLFSKGETYRKGTSQWTYEEKMLFVKLFKQLGRNWNEISSQIASKSPSQVRNFFQNYKKKLKLDTFSSGQETETILAGAGMTKKSI